MACLITWTLETITFRNIDRTKRGTAMNSEPLARDRYRQAQKCKGYHRGYVTTVGRYGGYKRKVT